MSVYSMLHFCNWQWGGYRRKSAYHVWRIPFLRLLCTVNVLFVTAVFVSGHYVQLFPNKCNAITHVIVLSNLVFPTE
jgi:hypothetical protein